MNDRKGMGARDAACRFLARPVDKRLGERRRQLAAQVDPRDRALFHELVAGTTRREVTLDALMAAFSKAKIERIENRLRTIIRVALYQIVYLDRIPHRSAVAEALKLIPSKKARGFANGVLRQMLRESRHIKGAADERARMRHVLAVADQVIFDCDRPFLPDPEQDEAGYWAVVSGFSREAAAILSESLGRNVARDVMKHAAQRPHGAVRLCGSPENDAALLLELKAAGVELHSIEEGGGRHFGLPRGVDPATLDAFADGRLTVQGPFAARVAPLFSDREFSRLLDLCAPPGGKTVHLAEMHPQAQIVAFAADERGRIRLSATLKRCGHKQITVVTRPDDPFDHGPFDAILLDVPCSNTGVLSRRPEARHRLTAGNLDSLARLQEQILESAIMKSLEVPAATRVVYSTCSILPQENGDLVERVVSRHPRAEIAREIASLPSGRWQDGGYAALISISPQS